MHEIALGATTGAFGFLGVIGLAPVKRPKTFRAVTDETFDNPPVRARLRFVCGVTRRLVHRHGEGTQAVDA